jgi:hypothetical protein
MSLEQLSALTTGRTRFSETYPDATAVAFTKFKARGGIQQSEVTRIVALKYQCADDIDELQGVYAPFNS